MLIAVLAAGPQRQLQFARLLHAEDELPESSPQRQLRVDERPEGCKDERPDCAGWAAVLRQPADARDAVGAAGVAGVAAAVGQ